MRELLCKAKREYGDEWIKGYYVCFNNEHHRIYTGCIKKDLDEYYHKWNQIKPDTLCQKTHMKDINGKEVWENDIVETSNGFLLQVVWSDKYQEFLFKNLKVPYDFMKNNPSELDAFAKDKKIKIVGNMFDGVLAKETT